MHLRFTDDSSLIQDIYQLSHVDIADEYVVHVFKNPLEYGVGSRSFTYLLMAGHSTEQKITVGVKNGSNNIRQ